MGGMREAVDDPETRRRQVALFRHAIIGELDIERLPRGQRSARIADLAARTYRPPAGGERRFSARTLWAWWSAYRRHGLEGLLPQRRKDRGTLRALSPEILNAAIAARREIPSRSTATVIDVLETQGQVVQGQLRRATLDRHLAHAGASRRRLRTLGDKRYIRLPFERPSQFWVGDYHEAPLLWGPARARYHTLHLCAVIDHYSKLVPHAAWYTIEQVARPWRTASSRPSSPAACLRPSASMTARPTAPTSSPSPALISASSSGTARRMPAKAAAPSSGGIGPSSSSSSRSSGPCGWTIAGRSSSASRPGSSSATT
jgi:hypothetical protein